MKSESAEYKKEWYLNNKMRILDLRKKNYQTHKEEILKRVTRYTSLYPERKFAVNKARQVKIPIGQICEICKVDFATHKHHPDYTHPLEVIFLCVSCHKTWHTRGAS